VDSKYGKPDLKHMAYAGRGCNFVLVDAQCVIIDIYDAQRMCLSAEDQQWFGMLFCSGLQESRS
jgi:hypothetical protein